MTQSALEFLSAPQKGSDQRSDFWLLVEAGDVDWANHANNLDSSIGAVFSGDKAFATIVNWVDENAAWDDTAVFVTSDHGHFLVIENVDAIGKAAQKAAAANR